MDLSWAYASCCVSSNCQQEVSLYIIFIEIFFCAHNATSARIGILFAKCVEMSWIQRANSSQFWN